MRKWDGIHAAIAANEEWVFAHERIMLPDDDLRMTAADIGALFAIGEALDLRLYQPAISGYGSWRHLFARCDCLIRYVNLIELMTPVIRRDILRKIWRHFGSMREAFGLDLYWRKFADFPHCAVLDCVPVEHTRPVHSAARGRWPLGELIRHSLALRLAHGFLPPRAMLRITDSVAVVRDDMRVEYPPWLCEQRARFLPRVFAGKTAEAIIENPAAGALKTTRGRKTAAARKFERYAQGKDFESLRRFDRRSARGAVAALGKRG